MIEGGFPRNAFKTSCVVLSRSSIHVSTNVILDCQRSFLGTRILVGSLATWDAGSAAKDAERKPALLRELRPSCSDGSRRTFCGRGPWLAVPLAVGAGLGVGFALLGAFFADIEGEGDGDGRAGPVPLVWIPGGIGRFAFPAGTAAGAAVATGPIASVGKGFARTGVRDRQSYPRACLFVRS